MQNVAHAALVVDGDVAVLPDDLRELLLGDLLRAAADLGMSSAETVNERMIRYLGTGANGTRP